MRAIVVLALLLGGCAVELPSAPRVVLSVVDGSGELPEYLEAAESWSPLGFAVEFGAWSGDNECPRYWYQTDTTDCQITIEVIRPAMLREREGVNALSDIAARGIAIDPRVVDRLDVLIAFAHETGHILLDTPRHTVGGIMGGSTWQLRQVDRDLACETIHRCL